MKMNNEIRNEIHQVGDLVRQLYDHIGRIENKRYLYKDLKELTLIEINTIITIGLGEMKSMSQIANSLGVTLGTPTVTIDRLIKKGYAERIRDIGDRRQVFIKLSEKGRSVYDSVIDLKKKVTERVIGALDEEERKMMLQVLSKINSRFEELFSDIEKSVY
jgi:DNA-binding MarR family transcriptional regulator